MPEYVNKELAKHEFNLKFGDVYDAVCAGRIIDSLPSINIVHCVECKHRVQYHPANGEDYWNCENPVAGMLTGFKLKDDDFCRYGERVSECNS